MATKKAATKKTTTKKSATSKTAKKPVAKKATTKKKRAKAKKMAALDAAAQVLTKAKEPMTTKEMIAAMANQKLWTSPGGKTPHATLYSAILREINTKGKEARFKKTERGKFTAKA